jgi:hypothetical protein
MTPTAATAAPVQMLTNAAGKPVTVSPSSLMDFIKSPHLYYLARMKGVAWPRGAFPSLPDGVDDVLKKHYDRWRPAGLPPEVRNFGVSGKLYPAQAVVDKARTRGKKGLAPVVVTAVVNGKTYGVLLQGEMDELLLCHDGRVGVWDNKTKGAAPKGEEDALKWYGVQMDAYSLILEAQPKEFWGDDAPLGVYPYAHLAYYFPEKADGAAETGEVRLDFRAQVVRIPCSSLRAKALVQEVVRCFAGPLPPLVGPQADPMLQEAPLFLKKYQDYMAGKPLAS